MAAIALYVVSCRYGYQELDGAASTGATGGVAGASSGGNDTPSAGAVQTNGGQNQAGETLGGGNPSEGGQSPGAAGQSSATAGAAEAGAAGATHATGCTNTPDCDCATFSGHAYWFCRSALEQTDAEAHCETQAMHLVRVDTQAENDFLGTTGAASSVFTLNGFALIGANDQAVAGEWRWRDGTLFWQGGPAGSAVDGLFSKWTASSPSSSGIQQCAGLLDTGLWQVRSCTAVVPFICEAP